MREDIIARLASMGLASTCTFSSLFDSPPGDRATFLKVRLEMSRERQRIKTINDVDGEVLYWTITVVPVLDMGEVLWDTTTDEKIMYLNNSAPLLNAKGYWDCDVEEDTDPIRQWDEFFYRFENLDDAKNMMEFIRLSDLAD